MSDEAVEFVRSRLRKMSYQERKEVADATGVPFGTIHKLCYGASTNPTVKTLTPLYRYFEDKEARES